MSTPVWKGSDEIQEEPGSPHEIITADGRRMTRRYRGPYTKLQSERPLIDTVIDGLPVTQIDIIREQAGSGRMIVELAAIDPVREPTFEIEWVSLEKPLLTAPFFADLTDGDKDAIAEWESAASAADRATALAALSGRTLALQYIDKRLKGVDAYFIPAPCARRTSYTSARPSSTRCGKRETPSGFPGLPPGYDWLKTSDRAFRVGKWGLWERIEEWTGADEWDQDIYG